MFDPHVHFNVSHVILFLHLWKVRGMGVRETLFAAKCRHVLANKIFLLIYHIPNESIFYNCFLFQVNNRVSIFLFAFGLEYLVGRIENIVQILEIYQALDDTSWKKYQSDAMQRETHTHKNHTIYIFTKKNYEKLLVYTGH